MTFDEIDQKYGKLTKMFDVIHGTNPEGEHFTIQRNKAKTMYTISTLKNGELYVEEYSKNT